MRQKTRKCYQCLAQMPFERSTKRFCSDRCKMAYHRKLAGSAEHRRTAVAETKARSELLDQLVATGRLPFDEASSWQGLHPRVAAAKATASDQRPAAIKNTKQSAAFLKMAGKLTLSVRDLAANRPGLATGRFAPEGKAFARRRLDDIIAEIEKLKLAL